MKKMITITVLSLSSFMLFGQSSLLPEPIPQPPSNSNFYYKNSGQVTDHLGTARYDVKYYTERSYPSMYLMEDKVAFCNTSFGDTSIVGAMDTLRRIDMKFVCDRKEDERGTVQMPMVCGTLKQYEESADHLNYYLPHCGSSGITGVKGYARIVYEDVFPDINVHLYSNAKGPKMLFEIKPGGNPSEIQLLFSGQDSIAATLSGLEMYLGAWEMTLPNAYAYEIDAITNATTVLTWLPVWNHSGGGNVNVFTGSYNSSNTLVIAVGGDPSTPLAMQNMDWAVYYGDDGEQRDSRIAADDKAIYHGMTQLAINFEAVPGQQQIDPQPNRGDWYISKFTDTYRDWATYYGGTKRDILTDIKTYSGPDAHYVGGVWVGGHTNSNDVLNGPVAPPGCFKQTLDAGNPAQQPKDGLLASFDKTDGSLKYNTYFGSNAEEFISRIAIDEENRMLYIVGGTRYAATFVNACASQTSGGFPLCSGSGLYFKGTKNTPEADDCFIAQFRLKDMNLLWSTLYGGEGHEEITYAETHKGKLYVGGVTFSQNFDEYPSPTTSHSADRFPLAQMDGAFFQNSNNIDLRYNNFISCFDEEKKLVWSTLLGSGLGVSGIDFNSKNDLYVLCTNVPFYMFAPSSTSGNPYGQVPTFDNGIGYYETLSSDRQNGTLLKFDEDLNFIWGTKLHSRHSNGFTHRAPHNYRSGLTVDEDDRVFIFTSLDAVASATFTVNLAGAYWQADNSATGVSSPISSLFDNFIYGFDNNDNLKWATFFGGTSSTLGSFDIAQGIVSQNQYIYVTGMTECPSSPYTQCPYPYSYCDQTYNQGFDGFIARFNKNILPVGLKGNNRQELPVSVFPNPSGNGVFNINFANNGTLKAGSSIRVQVSDLSGRIVAATGYKIVAGPNSFKLDIAALPVGTYFISLSNDNINGSVKIIKY